MPGRLPFCICQGLRRDITATKAAPRSKPHAISVTHLRQQCALGGMVQQNTYVIEIRSP